MEGETDAIPLMDGETSACKWCPYKGICGFDERLEGCSYRRLERGEDVIGRMQNAVRENQETENEKQGAHAVKGGE